MSSRLRGIAAVNAQIIAEGGYTTGDGTVVAVGPALEAAVSGTVSHPPDGLINVPHIATSHGTLFEVTAEGSLQAARRLHLAGAARIAVLNFASARNPGGGYLGGAKAQEEDLCRHSLLYPCLLQTPDYYAAHRASADLLYSHRVIWSPDVPVHRGDDGRLLAEPYPVSFLTSAAPNAGEALRRDTTVRDQIPRVLHQRAERVLTVAAHHGARQLVLGAWGCGVFRNDPRQVAEASTPTSPQAARSPRCSKGCCSRYGTVHPAPSTELRSPSASRRGELASERHEPQADGASRSASGSPFIHLRRTEEVFERLVSAMMSVWWPTVRLADR